MAPHLIGHLIGHLVGHLIGPNERTVRSTTGCGSYRDQQGQLPPANYSDSSISATNPQSFPVQY
jgi:hypothetical protein